MNRSVNVLEAIEQCVPSLTLDELTSISRLSIAIAHAINCTEELHSTLNPRARSLIITKLQEADHWCLELTRIDRK